MARITIRTTYALDPETVEALARMAGRWGVSKSEALRRAIRAAAAADPGPAAEAVRALEELQRSLALTRRRADTWARRARAERRSASARREGTGR
jgi:hypothetical protein